MILRRSVILALGSMPLLTRNALSQTAVKVRHVGLLSSGAPFADTSEIVVGLKTGFSKRGYVVGGVSAASGGQRKRTRTGCRNSSMI